MKSYVKKHREFDKIIIPSTTTDFENCIILFKEHSVEYLIGTVNVSTTGMDYKACCYILNKDKTIGKLLKHWRGETSSKQFTNAIKSIK